MAIGRTRSAPPIIPGIPGRPLQGPFAARERKPNPRIRWEGPETGGHTIMPRMGGKPLKVIVPPLEVARYALEQGQTTKKDAGLYLVRQLAAPKMSKEARLECLDRARQYFQEDGCAAEVVQACRLIAEITGDKKDELEQRAAEALSLLVQGAFVEAAVRYQLLTSDAPAGQKNCFIAQEAKCWEMIAGNYPGRAAVQPLEMAIALYEKLEYAGAAARCLRTCGDRTGGAEALGFYLKAADLFQAAGLAADGKEARSKAARWAEYTGQQEQAGELFLETGGDEEVARFWTRQGDKALFNKEMEAAVSAYEKGAGHYFKIEQKREAIELLTRALKCVPGGSRRALWNKYDDLARQNQASLPLETAPPENPAIQLKKQLEGEFEAAASTANNYLKSGRYVEAFRHLLEACNKLEMKLGKIADWPKETQLKMAELWKMCGNTGLAIKRKGKTESRLGMTVTAYQKAQEILRANQRHDDAYALNDYLEAFAAIPRRM